MASERPIRRKPCSHTNNFESLIAFRNTYVWGGGGDGGKRDWGRFKWFSGCSMLTVIFFSLSLSPPPPPRLHTQMVILSKVSIQASVRLNIFYCIFKPAEQWGWATSSHNISYGPPPTETYRVLCSHMVVWN